MRSEAHESGFTLIEILTVVAIIGIITVLAIPAYQSAMIRTKRSVMFTNLKTMSEDQQLYYSDTGHFYPAGWSWGRYSYSFKIIYPRTHFELQGSKRTLRQNRRYVYYLYRFEPFYSEPIIYAYALKSYGNDLDGDSYPDLWIKVGSGQPQVYYDDLKNSRHSVVWN